MWCKSNVMLPYFTWDSNCSLRNQTNNLPSLPFTSQITSGNVYLELLDPSNPGPGNPSDFDEVQCMVPVSSITPIADYLTGYYRPDVGYALRCATITTNEKNVLNFAAYISIYSGETYENP